MATWTPEQYRAWALKHATTPDRPPEAKNAPEVTQATIKANPAPRRIRQSQKPEMNKLELEALVHLKGGFTSFAVFHCQAKRFRLGNGIWYKPDITVTTGNRESAFEIKGPFAHRGGFENLKVAAGIYTEMDWWLMWKSDRVWQQQRVLP